MLLPCSSTPRNACRFKEEWAAKREADAARMRQLQAEAAARAAAKAEAAGASPSATNNDPSSSGAGYASSDVSTGSPCSRAAGSSSGPGVQAASVAERPAVAATHGSPVMRWCVDAVMHSCHALATSGDSAVAPTALSAAGEQAHGSSCSPPSTGTACESSTAPCSTTGCSIPAAGSHSAAPAHSPRGCATQAPLACSQLHVKR